MGDAKGKVGRINLMGNPGTRLRFSSSSWVGQGRMSQGVFWTAKSGTQRSNQKGGNLHEDGPCSLAVMLFWRIANRSATSERVSTGKPKLIQQPRFVFLWFGTMWYKLLSAAFGVAYGPNGRLSCL